jgi:hypothetical protein
VSFGVGLAIAATSALTVEVAANSATLVLDPASPQSGPAGTTVIFDYNWATTNCAPGTTNTIVLEWDVPYQQIGTAPVASDATGCHGTVSGKVPAGSPTGPHGAEAWIVVVLGGQSLIESGSMAFSPHNAFVVPSPSSPTPTLRPTPTPTHRPAATASPGPTPAPATAATPSATPSPSPYATASPSPVPTPSARLKNPILVQPLSTHIGFPAFGWAAIGVVGLGLSALFFRYQRRRGPTDTPRDK